MAEKVKYFISIINRQNTVILLFFLVIANFFSLTLTGGEEQYLAFARQYMNPEWMPNSFALNHPAGGNLAFQILTGYLLKFFSFETVAIFGRIMNYLMYALPLALILKRLKISNLEMAFILQVIYFGHQSLYAGEWIFGGLEEKTLAYIFVFWSIYFLLCDRAVISSAFTAIATYFHFLVGGWVFGLVFLYFLLRKKKLSEIFLTGGTYLVLILPFIIYLYKTYMVNNPGIINGINTNIIYAYWRLRHHVGIYSNFWHFFYYPMGGVITTLLMFILCIKYFRKIPDENIRQFNLLNIILFSQQFLFAIVGIFDKEGILMKTYPFRTNALSTLLFLFEFVLVAKYYLPSRLYPFFRQKIALRKAHPGRKVIFSNSLNIIMMLVAFVMLFIEAGETVRNLTKSKDYDNNMLELISYAKENTSGSSVFLFADSDRPYAFIRLAERERFVVTKFTPTRSSAIYEWYKRAMLKKKLQREINYLDTIRMEYRIDYLVSDSVYNYSGLQMEKSFGDHLLYRVK